MIRPGETATLKVSSRALKWKSSENQGQIQEAYSTAKTVLPKRRNEHKRQQPPQEHDRRSYRGNESHRPAASSSPKGLHQHPGQPLRPLRAITPLSQKGQRMQELLNDYQRDENSWGDETVKAELWQIVNGWATQRTWWNLEDADLAAALLRQLEHMGETITLDQYTALINGYAKCPSNSRAAHHANNILDHMERKSIETGNPKIWPGRFTINTVIQAYAKCSEPGTAKLAEQLLIKLERDYANGDETRKPNPRSYGKVIDAYASENNPEKAESILRRLEQQALDPHTDIERNIIPYTSVIQAYAKKKQDGRALHSNTHGRAKNGGGMVPTVHADRAERILRDAMTLYEDRGIKTMKPDAQLFTAAIDCWAKSDCKNKASRAFNVLQLMNQAGIRGDAILYNSVINALVSSGTRQDLEQAMELLHYLEEQAELNPDSYTYNGILNGHSRLGMADEAELLMDHWRERYLAGVASEMPDAISYTTLMKCWINKEDCQSTQAAFKAEEILNFMERNNIDPTTITYNTILNAWARSIEEKTAPRRAMEIWKRMKTHDKFSYIPIIQCHARYNLSKEAFEMMCRGIKSGVLRGDNQLFAQVLASCSRDATVDDFMGERVLEWINSHGGRPDAVCYNAVLTRYAKMESLDGARYAMELFHRMEESLVQPSGVTYSMLVGACTLDSGYLVELFEKCIGAGLLDEKVESAFREFGPSIVQDRLQHVRLEWSRNASRGPRGPSRKQIHYRQSKNHRYNGRQVEKYAW